MEAAFGDRGMKKVVIGKINHHTRTHTHTHTYTRTQCARVRIYMHSNYDKTQNVCFSKSIAHNDNVDNADDNDDDNNNNNNDNE